MAFKLPERAYYTVHELMNHWKCEENDIRRYILEKQLIPSYSFNGVGHVVKFEETEDENGKYWSHLYVERDKSDDEEAGLKYQPVWTDGFYYLVHPWQTVPLECNFSFFSKNRNHIKSSGETCLYSTKASPSKNVMTLSDVIRHCVVMSTEVALFEETKESDEILISAKPLGTTERNALLTIIATLAKAAKVPLDDYNRPGKAAIFIEGLTAEFGAHVSKRCIEDHLKEIPDALRTRMK